MGSVAFANTPSNTPPPADTSSPADAPANAPAPANVDIDTSVPLGADANLGVDFADWFFLPEKENDPSIMISGYESVEYQSGSSFILGPI